MINLCNRSYFALTVSTNLESSCLSVVIDDYSYFHHADEHDASEI